MDSNTAAVQTLQPATTEAALRDIFKQRIAMLDGAYGTAIQNQRLSESHYRSELNQHINIDQLGNHDVLNLTHPNAVA